MKKFLALLLLLLNYVVANAQISEEDPKVIWAQADTSQQVLGAQVSITVEYRSESLLIEPTDSISGALLLEGSNDTTETHIVSTRTYLLLDTGTVVFPPWKVDWNGHRYATSIIYINVSLSPLNEDIQREENRALKTVGFNLWWWMRHYWLYLTAVLISIVAIIILLRNYRKRSIKELVIPEVPRDLFAEAIAGLAKLRKEKSWEVDAKGYYVKLGDLVRIYLGAQTGLPLAEQTTNDSMDMLKNKWTDAQLQAYQYILTRADYVKFAKGRVDVSEHLEALDQAESLILEFKPAAHDS